jgi:hypothetical protein
MQWKRRLFLGGVVGVITPFEAVTELFFSSQMVVSIVNVFDDECEVFLMLFVHRY